MNTAGVSSAASLSRASVCTPVMSRDVHHPAPAHAWGAGRGCTAWTAPALWSDGGLLAHAFVLIFFFHKPLLKDRVIHLELRKLIFFGSSVRESFSLRAWTSAFKSRLLASSSRLSSASWPTASPFSMALFLAIWCLISSSC